MHEFSLAQALLEQVDDLRRQHRARSVVAVRVEVGEFSGIETECLRSALDVLTDGSELPTFELRTVPLAIQCGDCGKAATLDRADYRCPRCGSAAVTVERGDGLVLRDVTLEGHA